MDKLEKIAKRYFNKSEVVFITSDGLAFIEFPFAERHAQKNGLQIKEYKKPVKAKKNGIK